MHEWSCQQKVYFFHYFISTSARILLILLFVIVKTLYLIRYVNPVIQTLPGMFLSLSACRQLAIVCIFIFLSLPAVRAQWMTPKTEVTLNEPVGYTYEISGLQGQQAQWQPGGVWREIGPISAFGIVTFTAVGPGTVSWSTVSGVSRQLAVNVHPQKPTIQSIAPAVVCGNNQVTITVSHPATPGSTNTFRWYTTETGGSSFTTTGTTLTQTVSASTSWWVSTYNTVGGESLTRTRVNIVVNNTVVNAPSVTPAFGIAGGPVTLEAGYAGPTISYKWQEPSGTTSTTTSNLFPTTTPNSSTSNFVTVRLVNGTCESPATAIPITVYPAPVLTGTGISLGQPATLTCTPVIYDSYTWYLNGNQVYSTTNPANNTYKTTALGTYTVVVTKNGASGTSNPFTLASGMQFKGQDENYIVINTIKKKNVTTAGAVDGLNNMGNTQTVQYFDGLGRPMQTVMTQGSPSGNDLVQPVVYDKLGREARKYLPIVLDTKDGWYKRDIIGTGDYAGAAAINVYNNQATDYVTDDSHPYAETRLEFSPLNRVIEQGAAGALWQPDPASTYANPVATDHAIKKAYEFNGANEVLRWTHAPATGYPLGLVNAGTASAPVYYAANQLSRNRTKDEHQHEVIEYIDKEGRTVLKRVQADAGAWPLTDAGKDTYYASTYYIYDDFGSLVCVVPPEATRRLSAEYLGATDTDKEVFLNRWAFRYTYDAQRRMTQKKVPGAAVVYMVYDGRDRLVLTQDGNMRTKRQWLFTKYEAMNRAALTGMLTADTSLDQSGMQHRVNQFYTSAGSDAWYESLGGPVHGYTNRSFPQTDTLRNYLTVTYYDDYEFRTLFNSSAFDYKPNELVADGTHEGQANAITPIRGQITGTKIRMLTGESWLKTVNYYDDKYRLIQQISENVKDYTVTTSIYDFASRVARTKSSLYGGQPVSWTHVTNAQVNGDVLTGTPASSWTGGATSQQLLAPNTDGWSEVTVVTPGFMVGLGDQFVTVHINHIDYAFYLYAANTLYIRENGVSKANVGHAYPGDVLRVERVGGTVYYKVNGTIVYTSTVPSTSQLMSYISFGATGASIRQGRLSNAFGVQSPNTLLSSFTKRFLYDHAGRLLNTWHSLNGADEILLSRNTYNEIGQLIDKKLHSTAADASDARQSVDYRYNIRGWLTSINNATLSNDDIANDDANDFFGMNLDYEGNTGSGSGTPPSLVSWYKLDGNADDSAPDGLNGTFPGSTPAGTTDSQGNAGKAMSFNGPTQAIRLAGTEEKHAFIQNTGRFTIAAFIKLNDVNTRCEIFSNAGSAGINGFRFLYETTGSSYGNHQLRFTTFTTTSTSSLYKGEEYTINDTHWHHVAIVGDGKNVQFYVDGVADGTPKTITLFGNGPSSNATLIGGTLNPGSTTPVVGMYGGLDEVMVFDEPLSAQEIRGLMSHKPLESVHDNTAQYNGNISSIRWSKNQGLGEIKENAYHYDYDPLNRLTGALFQTKGTSAWQAWQNSGFAESNLSYDLNGNIKTLNRNDDRAIGMMDQLVYNYGTSGGNQLGSVRDYGDVLKGFVDGNTPTNDYTYDPNGNLLTDRNKGITTAIVYNHLNLPEQITKVSNRINYAYDATGAKHAQVVSMYDQRVSTEYVGPWVFENNALQFLQHDEGRITLSKRELVYKNTGEDLETLGVTSGASVVSEKVGTDTYIKVTGASGVTTKTGLLTTGNLTTFAVNAGDRYVFRVKGYYVSSAYFLYVQQNGADLIWQGALLQKGATNEAWVENVVAVQPGTTELTFGILRHGGSGGDAYVNDIEIYKISSDDPEYQYHLKDHLGNVRLTFTTKETIKEYTAGFEDANQDAESRNFENYPTGGGQINTQPTNANTGDNSHLLNGGYTGQIGVTKNFAVMPGDKLTIAAYAHYEGQSETPADFSAFVPALLAAFNLPTPAPGEVGTPSAGVSTYGEWEMGAGGNRSADDPVKAFVTIVLFDKDYNMIDVAYRASEASDELFSQSYTVTEPGYAYLYVSNEHPTRMDIYFDDITITHELSPVLQTNDYYPFGLTFHEYQRESAKANDYLYNGKERQDELGLGWMDYGARMYMSDIGRWPRIDPKAEMYFQITPYAYAANTPTNAIDPDGRLVIFINGQHSGTGGTAEYWEKKELVTRWNSYSFFGQTIWSGNETRPEVTVDFASAVQDHFSDYSPARFYDGALGGWLNTLTTTGDRPSNISSDHRYAMGKQQGEKDAAQIINSLARTGGVITESLKIVSHSMGGAYAKGFVQAIVDYAMAHPEECRGLKISEFDFDPLQAAHLRAIAGVHTEQYTHNAKKKGKSRLGGRLADGKQAGLDDEQGKKDGNSYVEDETKSDHSIISFYENIKDLEEGTYVFQNGQWVKQ